MDLRTSAYLNRSNKPTEYFSREPSKASLSGAQMMKRGLI
jgi:hypothetical protein